jgi:hypothetical protein
MLMSITPLGERSRGFSWRLTAGSFGLLAIAAGALGGAALGALGSLTPMGAWRAAVLLAVLVVAVGFDATGLRRWLPTTRRQVNEDWMTRYRGWVYGGAFGAQLGLGLATIVTSFAVYVAAAGAFLCGSALAGAAVGGAFGLTRAVSLLPARSVSDPAGLASLQQRLVRFDAPARGLVVACELVAIGLTILVLA